MFAGKLYFYNIAWQCKRFFFSIEKSRLLNMKKKNDGGK
jgi:hypothetical protein